MINRLFTLRSDRQSPPEQNPVGIDNQWPDQFDADFFAGTVRVETNYDDYTKYDTSQTKWRKVIFPILGATALSTALYFGVKAELAAENRKEAVEACVEKNLGVNIELEFNPATGEIIRPEKIYTDIVNCEAIVAGE